MTDLVQQLDIQTNQVSVEARIVSANKSFARSFGIIWGGALSMDSLHGNPTGVYFPNNVNVLGGLGNVNGVPNTFINLGSGGGSGGVQFKLGSINGIVDLDLKLDMAEVWGDAKILSAPKVTVLDNQSASIKSGIKIPYQTNSANTGISTSYEDAATSITVTPHVTADGAILMTLQVSKNSPVGGPAAQGNIATNEAQTQVIIKSGNTTVLGGVYETTTSNGYAGIPYLSRIPIIGWLFKASYKSVATNELLIFITPTIISDLREAISQ